MDRHEINRCTEPNLKLSVLTNKQDQMCDMLEATKKMMKYFKRSLNHIPSHPNNTDHHQSSTNTSHSNKHKCNPHYHKDEVNEITPVTYTPIPDNTNVDSSDGTMDSAYRLRMTILGTLNNRSETQ